MEPLEMTENLDKTKEEKHREELECLGRILYRCRNRLESDREEMMNATAVIDRFLSNIEIAVDSLDQFKTDLKYQADITQDCLRSIYRAQDKLNLKEACE